LAVMWFGRDGDLRKDDMAGNVLGLSETRGALYAVDFPMHCCRYQRRSEVGLEWEHWTLFLSLSHPSQTFPCTVGDYLLPPVLWAILVVTEVTPCHRSDSVRLMADSLVGLHKHDAVVAAQETRSRPQ
jgi:hypothetical protein